MEHIHLHKLGCLTFNDIMNNQIGIVNLNVMLSFYAQIQFVTSNYGAKFCIWLSVSNCNNM